MKKTLLSIFSLIIGIHLFAQSTALHFDGLNDYVKITGHTDLSGPKTITLETWVNVDNFNSSPCASCAPLIWHQGGAYRFGTGNGKGMHFELSDGSNTQVLNITSSILKDDTWHHLAGTFDGTWMRIYVDGVIQDSLRTKFSTIGYTSNNADIWIGDPVTGYGGIIEETRIWDYARSTKEINEGMISTYDKSSKGLLLQLSYEDGKPYKDNTKVSDVKDLSKLGNDGTLENLDLKDSVSNFVLGLSYCDSVVYGSTSVTACEQYKLPSGTKTVYKSGTYYDTIRSYQGCDSALTIKVSMLYNTTSKLSIVACDSFQSLADKTLIYRKSGKYQERIPNYVGCDSLINIDLVITRPSSKTLKYNECGSATLSGTGKVVTKSGVYVDTFMAWGGCDSLIVHDVRILESTSATVDLDLCSFVPCPTDRNVIYKKPGVYYDTIPNAKGCDSVITYNVISAKTTGEVSITACNSFKMPGSGKTVTESGTYRDTLYGANSKACDSFIVINLNLIKPKNESANVTACASYTSPGGKRITQSGKIFETYKSSMGCDSIIQTLNVTIINIDTKVNRDWNTLVSASKDVSGATFQWLDCKQDMQIIEGETSAEFAISGNGEYAVEIKQGSCTDTSRCVVFAFTNDNKVDQYKMRLFPNPNDGKFTLELDENLGLGTLRILDITGKYIWQESLSGRRSVTIDINVCAGIYQLEVIGSENRYSAPLIIE